MSERQFLRTEIMLGTDAIEKLHNSYVMVVGLGAVGSFCCEILARMGVGKFLLVDKDEIEDTNINRQIFALHSTIGMDKVDVAKKRIQDIHPKAQVETVKVYLNPENIEDYLKEKPDLIVDAVDIVKTKINMITVAQQQEIPIVCSMGAALKSDISMIKTAKLKKTKNCPLAFLLRKQLRKQGISLDVPVVYSEELPFEPEMEKNVDNAKDFLGSLPYITGAFGLNLGKIAIESLLSK